ncbi:hypothetical protein KKB11_03395 [Candidatus Micrarchaeota archaeon]|nr:hypothetical protein [Candidatus Micrarchaeota archaeon]
MTNWFFFQEIPRSHYHLFEGVFSYWGKEMKKDIGVSIDLLGVFKNGDTSYFMDRKNFSKAGKTIFKKTLSNPKWFISKNKKIEKISNALIKNSDKLLKTDFSVLSLKQLAKIYEKHNKLHQACHVSGQLAIILEWDHELLTNYLKDLLEKTIKEKNLSLKSGETFSVLTTPLKDSFQLKEEIKVIELALKFSVDAKTKNLFLSSEPDKIIELLPFVNKKFDVLLEKHFLEFRWLPFMYIGPAWNKDYFVARIKGLLKEKELSLIYSKMLSRHKEIKLKQKNLISLLSLNKKTVSLFDISKEMIYLKGLRKDAMYFSFYSYEPLLKELSKRLLLSVNQLRFLWPSELIKAINGKKFDVNLLNERRKFSVFVSLNGKTKTVVGFEARKLASLAPNPKDFKLKELEGTTAVPGMVKGLAKIINVPEDLPKMNQGDILVSHVTNPNLVPAMKKAAAIVTDIGGVTCHAAIVSRELNIPCVIGTKIATKVFKDNDFLNVNANHGIIKKVKR